MQCFPLTSIIFALGNPRIDYLSLDIEGAEFEVSIVITNSNDGILNKHNIKVLKPMISHIIEMHLYIFIKKVLESVPWNLVNIHMISVEIVRRKLNEYADGMHIDQYEDIVTPPESDSFCVRIPKRIRFLCLTTKALLHRGGSPPLLPC